MPSPPSDPRQRRHSAGEAKFTESQIRDAFSKLQKQMNSQTSMEVSTDVPTPTTLWTGKRRLDSDGFQSFLKPSKKGKPSASTKSKANPTVAPVQVSNRFAPLATPSTSSQNPPPPEPKPRRPPPIILESTSGEFSTPMLVNRLRGLGMKDFRIQAIRTGLKIFLNSEEDHTIATDYFRKSHTTKTPVSFFTYAPHGSKPNKKYLILGLDETHDIRSITAALQHDDLIDVGRLVTTVDGRRVETPNVLATFKPTYAYEKHLKHIRVIDHIVIRHKPFLNNQGLPTCTKCQALGHTKKYCWRPLRCVRCSGNHPVSECAPEAQPKCSNCGGDHPASFRQCPSRLRIISTRATASKIAKQNAAPQPAPRYPPPPPSSVWAFPSDSPPPRTPVHYPPFPEPNPHYPSQAFPAQPQPPTQPSLPDPNATPAWVTELTSTLTSSINTLVATVNSLLAAHPQMQSK